MITLTAKIEYEQDKFIEITPSNSISMQYALSDRADTSMPSWGIISNNGKLEFIDSNGKVKSLAEQNLLKKGVKVNIYLSNTSKNITANIYELFAQSWDYDSNNFKVSVDVSDELKNMQEVQATPYVYDLTQEKYFITAKDLYDFIQADTVAKGFNMATSAELDSNTIAHLSAISIPIPYFEQANLWNVWQNFCEAFQTHIFKGKNKKIVCVYNGGN
jgi:hypothetical protein